MSSKENKPKMGLKKKISDVRYYLYTNREYRKILKDILFENMDIDTFKRDTIITIEDNPKLNLDLSDDYIEDAILPKHFKHNTSHLPSGLKKLSFENNLYKEIIIDLFSNKIYFDAYKKIMELDLFDTVYYEKEYNYNLSVPAVFHYLYRGHDEGKNPSSYFDGNFYEDFNPNCRKSRLNPLVYFVLKGMDEGLIKMNKQFYQPKSINRLKLNENIKTFDKCGLNKEKRERKIIISLTSYPLRMDEIAYTIYSLLNQNLKADKVILWLAKEEFPNLEQDIPETILKFKENGLSIQWYHNIYSYKKLIPTLKKYPDELIVTVDDDIYYPQDWLEKLYRTHLSNPDDIIIHRARHMIMKNNKEFADYTTWKLIKEETDASYLNFMTGAGGILYPPHKLYQDVFNEERFLDLCKYGDDIWFWAMAILKHTKFKVVDDCFYDLIYVNPAREVNLLNEETLWLNNRKGSNDRQLKAVVKYYPEILEIISEDNQ